MLKFEPGTPAVYTSRLPVLTRKFNPGGERLGLHICRFGQTGQIFYRERPFTAIRGRPNLVDQERVFFVADGTDDVFIVLAKLVYLGEGRYLV